MARMSRKKFIIRMSPMGMCIITCPATGICQKDGIEYWIGVLFSWQPTFQSHVGLNILYRILIIRRSLAFPMIKMKSL